MMDEDFVSRWSNMRWLKIESKTTMNTWMTRKGTHIDWPIDVINFIQKCRQVAYGTTEREELWKIMDLKENLLDC